MLRLTAKVKTVMTAFGRSLHLECVNISLHSIKCSIPDEDVTHFRRNPPNRNQPNFKHRIDGDLSNPLEPADTGGEFAKNGSLSRLVIWG